MSRRRGQAASSSDIPDWLAVFVDTTQAQVQTSQRHIQALIERLEQQEEQSKEAATALQHQLAATASASPAPSQPASTPPSRPTSAPSPPKLTPGISLREFRALRATWTDYFELTDGRHLSAERQLALFRTCLSPEMRATLGRPARRDRPALSEAAETSHSTECTSSSANNSQVSHLTISMLLSANLRQTRNYVGLAWTRASLRESCLACARKTCARSFSLLRPSRTSCKLRLGVDRRQ